MVDKPEVRSIPNFYFGGAIPKAAMGDVLEAVILGGGKISELSPIFPDVQARPARIERKQQKLLPPPAKAATKKANGKPGRKRHGLFEATAHALLKGPLSRSELTAEIVAAGENKTQISNVKKLEIRGLLRRNAKGEFVLTAKGRKEYEKICSAGVLAAEAAMESGDTTSQIEIVRQMLSDAFPKEVTYSSMSSEFERRKLRKHSASVALNKLRQQNEAKKGTTKGSWLFVPSTHQQQAA